MTSEKVETVQCYKSYKAISKQLEILRLVYKYRA